METWSTSSAPYSTRSSDRTDESRAAAGVRPRRTTRIAASALIAAAPDDVFSFLSDLENHWLLTDPFVEIVRLDRGPDGVTRGGQVRVRGPLGLTRTVATQVVSTQPVNSITGTADLSGGTRAVVRWTLSPAGGDTWVGLSAHLERAGVLDRLLLAAGGRHWIRRRFAAILATLGARFSSRA